MKTTMRLWTALCAILRLALILGAAYSSPLALQAQGNSNGANANGQCNHAEAVALHDPTVAALLDNWNTGCWRLDPVQCTPIGELIVLCAEHPCPAPVYLVELTWPIRSFLCAVLVPPPGHIKVHVILGPGGGSATVVEAPFF
jgi:hypothetical protein